MEKKAYIAPQTEVTEIDTVQMLAGSLVFNDKEVDTEQQLSNDRRGTWGNLWDDGEKKWLKALSLKKCSILILKMLVCEEARRDDVPPFFFTFSPLTLNL